MGRCDIAAAGADLATAGAATSFAATGAFAGAPVAARPVAPPAPAITATTAPTFATSPTLKLISVSVPPSVAGTSIDVLSVSISNRLSPGFTASPALTNH